MRIRHRRRPTPILSDQPVVARHPVAWLRIVALCVVGSLLLTAVYVWGLRDWVRERGVVRDAQYQRTQQELARQRERIAQLENAQAADDDRIAELERRLRVTSSPTPSAHADGSGGQAEPRASAAPTGRGAAASSPQPRPSTTRPAPSPVKPPPSEPPADDVPLLCLPIVGCLL